MVPGLPPAALRADTPAAAAARVLAAALLAALVAAVAILAGPGGERVDAPLEQAAVCLVFALAAALAVLRPLHVERDRGPWASQAAGLVVLGLGFVLLYAGAGLAAASIAWLAFFPFTYACGALLMRTWASDVRAPALVDGALAGTGIAAAVLVLFLTPVRDLADPGLASGLAYFYPVSEVLLLTTVVVGGIAAAVVPGRGWLLAGAAFAALLAGHLGYLEALTSRTADPALLPVPTILLMAGATAMALASWQPEREIRMDARDWLAWRTLLIPTIGVTCAIATMTQFTLADRPLAVSLASFTIAIAVVRTLFTQQELRTATATNRIALTDDLTGLGTRRAFGLRVEQALAAARRTGDPVAVVVLDLEGFGAITGALGTRGGDEGLRRVADRLRALLATEPGADVARLGADEYAVVLPGRDAAHAQEAARRLLAGVGAPMTVADVALELGAHAGSAVAPADGTDADALMRHAEAALEHARRANDVVVAYEPAFDEVARSRLTVLGQLREALDSGAIVAHFQPQVIPTTGAAVGAEALVRWEHPERGLVPPAAFLDIAATSGLMGALTERVLDLALTRAAAWDAEGLPAGISVNIAAANLFDRDFAANVAEALARSGLPATALTLEITEDIVMADFEQAMEDLGRLRALGVRLALDDFGTGRSSLEKLKRLPIQELKIDRSFVMRLGEDRDDLAIVEATVRLAHALGLSVVAEGIEDDDSWTLLARLGCDVLQGYRLSRPLAPAAIDTWLAAAPIALPPALERRVQRVSSAGENR